MCADTQGRLSTQERPEGHAAHIPPMNLAEYMPLAVAALDAVPESKLAVSLDNLYCADDTYMIGLDLVESYVRKADPRLLTRSQNHDIDRFRFAENIINGRVLLGGRTSYRNVRANMYDLAGSILDLATDGEARALVARLVKAEPVLQWLVADRYDKKVRERDPGYRGGPDLEDHLIDIEASLNSDPEGRLAVSLDNLRGSDRGHELGVLLVMDYVRANDPATLNGQLFDDVSRLRRATAILDNKITLNRMTFANLQANVRGMMGDLSNFATTTEARDIARRIVAAVPGLAADIAAQPPVIAY
jgi:hypothetical protein